MYQVSLNGVMKPNSISTIFLKVVTCGCMQYFAWCTLLSEELCSAENVITKQREKSGLVTN